jgi:caspase 7
VDMNAERYKMTHGRRGTAIIFNHHHFDNEALKDRDGTEKDKALLKVILQKLDFDVKIFDDLTFEKMKDKAKKVAKDETNVDADCVLVAILTHGQFGQLWAKDQRYQIQDLWKHFDAKRAPFLAGKPKIFVIQVFI